MNNISPNRGRLTCALAAGLVACGFILSGCSSAPDESKQTAGAKLLGNLSQIESEVLADKKVTRAEMQKTLQRYTQCIEAANLKVVDSGGDKLTISRLQIDYGSDMSTYDASEKKVQECRSEVDAIDAVWEMQNAPSADDRKKALATFVTCLKAAGVQVPDNASEDAVMQAYRLAGETATKTDPKASAPGSSCASDYSQTVGIAPVDGLSDALKGLK